MYIRTCTSAALTSHPGCDYVYVSSNLWCSCVFMYVYSTCVVHSYVCMCSYCIRMCVRTYVCMYIMASFREIPP